MKEQFKLRVSAKISRWNGNTYPLWQERVTEVELVPGASREDELRAIELLCESMARALKDVAEEEQELPCKDAELSSTKQVGVDLGAVDGFKTVPIVQMEPMSPA